MNNGYQQLFNKLEKALGFVFLIPLAVYYLGFIFIQGTIINNMSSIYDQWYSVVSSISSKLYLISGIVQLVALVIATIAATMFFFLIYYGLTIILKGLKKLLPNWTSSVSSQTTKIMGNKWLRSIVQIFYVSLLLFAVYCAFKITNSILSQSNFTTMYGIIYYVVMVFQIEVIVFLFFIVSPKILGNIDGKMRIAISVEVILLGIVLVTLTVYYIGVKTFDSKLKDYGQDNGKIKVSTIYFDNNTTEEYLTIDISNDSFVGFDNAKDGIVVIPMDKIKSINTRQADKVKEFQKYNLDILTSNKNLSEEDSAALVVKKFYDYRTSTDFSKGKEFVNLLSKELYSKGYDSIAPQMLQEKWKLNNKFKEQDLSDFLGISMSEPQSYIEDGQKVGYQFYVIEYFKEKSYYSSYILRYEDGSYKVFNVLESNKFFLK